MKLSSNTHRISENPHISFFKKFQKIQTSSMLIKNKFQNIKILPNLPKVLPILHLSPQIWLLVNGKDKGLSRSILLPAHLWAVPSDKRQARGAWINQFPLPLLTAPLPVKTPKSEWLEERLMPVQVPFCQLCTWAVSRDKHIPSCQTLSVTSSALNF